MGYVYGTRWTCEKIETELKKVQKALDIERMPTNNEMKMVTKNTKLSNAIRRNGGFLVWSIKIGANQSECETRLGFDGEMKIKSILENMGYKVDKMTTKHPYDLLANDNIKIDIKTAHRYTSDTGWSSYSFNLEKKNPTCDIYIFYCIDDDKILVIPSKYLKQTQLCITDKKSKYDKYRDRYDYLKKYDEFYRNVI